MKLRSTPAMLPASGIMVLALTGVALAVTQTASQEKPLLSDQPFKNIHVLKGIPVDNFMETMGIM
jgi:hypothetical protein